MAASYPTQTLAAGTLLQHVSRVKYAGQPLFFGSAGTNRYDDPAKLFGVMYLAFDLPTALMESMFHQHKWLRNRASITLSETQQRLVRAVGLHTELKLADLSAPNFMAAGLRMNLHQFTSRNYRRTQQIAADIHAHVPPDNQLFDGLIYPSRNNYPSRCVALFKRACSKVAVVDDIELPDHIEWPGFLHDFEITVLPR
ncbi:MAG: hypothetical protein RL748_1051 [Pseudomonadota bacterium]|jgi:hypothetical protein